MRPASLERLIVKSAFISEPYHQQEFELLAYRSELNTAAIFYKFSRYQLAKLISNLRNSWKDLGKKHRPLSWRVDVKAA
ncbi:MAG: hypothetical protein ACFB0E_21540 [Leptolyngbyaceae cyanobacterium]